MATKCDVRLETSKLNPFTEIAYDDLVFYDYCGGGSFGKVYKCEWKSTGKIVAVKKLTEAAQEMSESESVMFRKEAQVWSVLNHENIIRFYGAVTKGTQFCIITEFAEYGSLYSYLTKRNKEAIIHFNEILDWSTQIASGMRYLHEEAPKKVIHRDLKSTNIVITSDFVCKICDFGTSRFLEHTTNMTIAGTARWMAPEVIQHLPVSGACDVWSFGVVLWELVTHKVPFEGLNNIQVEWAVVVKGERLTIPSFCPEKFSELITACWKENPRERLTFTQIRSHLLSMRDDEQLRDQATFYLSKRNQWSQDFDSSFQLMKDLSLKQKELEEWESRLPEKEQKLERQWSIPETTVHKNTNLSSKVVLSKFTVGRVPTSPSSFSRQPETTVPISLLGYFESPFDNWTPSESQPSSISSF